MSHPGWDSIPGIDSGFTHQDKNSSENLIKTQVFLFFLASKMSKIITGEKEKEKTRKGMKTKTIERENIIRIRE